MDAVDRRAGGLLLFTLSALGFGQIPAHAHIREQHEILDEAVGLKHALDHHAQRLTGLVQFEFDLLCVEVDAARLEAPRTQLFGQRLQRLHLLREFAFAGFNAFLRLVVGKAAVAVDDSAAKPFLLDVRLRVHFKDCTEGESVLVGAQRAEVVGEHLGQHGNRAVHE